MKTLRLEKRRKLTSQDREDAVKLIDDIREENGDYQKFFERLKLDSENTRKFEGIIDSLTQKANASISLLADDLYTEPKRYIHELIQNADDCEYLFAEKEGSDPTLQFRLTENNITVISNEDGFTKENVRSICNVARSSKTTGEHTGQKGIGFKSVFAIAWKVHIRSDPYSFSFTPEQNGSKRGMSLVTPKNEESQELPDDQGTRLTLYHGSQHLEQRISELQSIDISTILFLKKLRKIVIEIDSPKIQQKTVYVRKDTGTLRILTKTPDSDGKNKPTFFTYIVNSRAVKGLPVEVGGPQTTESCVEIAFPVSNSMEPNTSQNQHVYACLPVQAYDFKFAINADFHVVANRESIKSTKRNQKLQSEIAALFCKEISILARIDTFRYSWLSYLWSGSSSNTFWCQLQEDIIERLQTSAIFYSTSGGDLFRGRELYYLPTLYRDEEGDPLFMGHISGRYLAKGYSSRHLSKLERLGVQNFTDSLFVEQMADDLNRDDSYVKTYHKLEDDHKRDSWHERVTGILTSIISARSSRLRPLQNKVRSLKCIPLTNRSWVEYGKDIFFDASLDGHAAPEDVTLKIVSNASLPMKYWKPVFEAWKISPVQSCDVVSKITEMHILSATNPARFSEKQLHSHLQYIFWNGTKDQKLSHHFILLNHLGERRPLRDHTDQRFYFKDSSADLSSFELLKSCDSLDVQFLHPKCVGLLPPEQTNSYGLTWKAWLSENVGIRKAPFLLHLPKNQNPKFSTELNHIKMRCPEKIVRLLLQNSSTYRRDFDESLLRAAEMIQKIKVPTANGLSLPIGQSYLPNPDLLDLCESLGIQGPVLSELCGSPSSDLTDKATKFLVKYFGVRDEDDTNFYLEALIELKRSKNSASVDQTKIKEIYGHIEKRCEIERKQNSEFEQALMRRFEEFDLIFYHDSENGIYQWLPPSRCLWDPDDGVFTGRISIYSQYQDLEDLFLHILNIDEPSLSMYVNDLEDRLGDESEENIATIKQILVKISSVIRDNQTPEFDSDNSLSADDDESISDSEVSESGLNSDMNLMSGSDHDHSGQSTTTGEEASNDEGGSSYESEEDDDAARAKLRRRGFKFLPVRNPDGSCRLESVKAAFAIPDSDELRDDFKEQIPMLDFNLSQVIDCYQLIEDIGLYPKKLSELGKYEIDIGGRQRCLDQTLIFREKAAAFCGCLKFFMKAEEKQLQDKYDLLSKVEVMKCEKLRKKFCLEFQSSPHEGGWRDAWLHDELEQSLVFIPEDLRQREYCNLVELPEAMMKFLEINHPKAKSVITMIVGASSIESATLMMRNVRIPLWLPHEKSEKLEEHSTSDQDNFTNRNITDLRLSLPNSVSPPNTWRVAHQLPIRTTPYTIDRRYDGYVEILNHVVQAAKQIDFPENGRSTQSESSRSYRGVAFADLFTPEQWAIEKRNSKVGAAGELFVYEILRRILHNDNTFGLKNWTSKIRHYVSGQREYANIPPWDGLYERTDLEYQDNSRILTNLLLEKGYIQIGSVVKEPKYLIEVKTGVGECESDFYMSTGQYKLIENKAMKEGERSAQVYILFRVFHIDQAEIGLRVFVDPWKERDKNLKFRDAGWTVKVIDQEFA